MKRPTDRRTVLVAAGAAAFAATIRTAAAQPADISGAITVAGGTAIPEGQIKIYVEDLAIQDSAGRRIAETSVNSDGGSKTIDFSLSLPARPTTALSTLQIVARLERLDGWLVARGSAQIKSGAPVNVTLNEVIY